MLYKKKGEINMAESCTLRNHCCKLGFSFVYWQVYLGRPELGIFFGVCVRVEVRGMRVFGFFLGVADDLIEKNKRVGHRWGPQGYSTV